MLQKERNNKFTTAHMVNQPGQEDSEQKTKENKVVLLQLKGCPKDYVMQL